VESVDGFTVAGLIASGGILATGANTAYNIFQAFRISSVDLWGISEGSGSIGTNFPPSVSIRWFNNLSAATLTSSQLYNDISLSSAFPAYLHCRPPKDLSELFLNVSGASNTVFEVILGPYTNAVIDVKLVLLLSDQSFTPASYTTGSSMTLGDVYYTSPDGVIGAKWTRQGLPTIN